MIHTFSVLLVFQTLGEGLAYALSLPVPGPVIGMLLLFLYLVLKEDAAPKLAPVSLALLKHLSLLFIPAGVGIMLHVNRVAQEWLPICCALLASTVISIVVTAAVVNRLQKRMRGSSQLGDGVVAAETRTDAHRPGGDQ
jgi:holin-like protein